MLTFIAGMLFGVGLVVLGVVLFLAAEVHEVRRQYPELDTRPRDLDGRVVRAGRLG